MWVVVSNQDLVIGVCEAGRLLTGLLFNHSVPQKGTKSAFSRNLFEFFCPWGTTLYHHFNIQQCDKIYTQYKKIYSNGKESLHRLSAVFVGVNHSNYSSSSEGELNVLT